jgi:glycosyltransferase involved in cell wall biosynthesis
MKISAILPVFNERERVEKIVKVLKEVDFLDEIIFVDDGSTDGSFDFLKENKDERIKVFRLKRNRGKGFALSFGIKKACGEILIFIDSDLVGLKKEHLKLLILPLLEEGKKCVIGVPLEKDRQLIRPWEIWLSGERAYFKKDILPHLEKISKLRYGIELFLDSIFTAEETEIIYLTGLLSPSKFEKMEFLEAMKEYFREVKEIFEDLKKLKIDPSFAKIILKSYIREIERRFFLKRMGG